MKKILSLALALMMLLALGACGSKGGGTSDDPNLGKYIGAEFSGDGSQWFLLDEIYDEGESYIELKSGGKGVFCLGGDATDIKWELKSDGSLKLTRDSLESSGTLQDGVITLTDLWGSAVTVTFIKGDGASSTEKTDNASGPMTATFLLPFAMGACDALGGNIVSDAFGIVAMVAMTPLITIQILGTIYRFRVGTSGSFIPVPAVSYLDQFADDDILEL